MLYVLIVNNYATLKEIRDEYSIDEVLDLYEICLVNIYNKNEIHNEVIDNGKVHQGR